MTLKVCLLTGFDYLHCVIIRYITARIDLIRCDCNSFSLLLLCDLKTDWVK